MGFLASRIEAQTAAGFRDEVVLSGLEAPTVVQFAADGRLFVAEKSGIIKVFDSLSDTTPTVFADLRTQVHNFLDRGLLGMALDPTFPTRPYLYVLYTRDANIGGSAPKFGVPGVSDDPCPNETATQGCTVSGRLSRLQANGNVMTGSEHVLVDGWFQQFPSHSVGTIAFGPDGALYASSGEGGHWATTTAGHPDYGQYGNPAGDPPVPVGGTQTPPTAEGGSLRAQDLRTAGDPVGLSGAVIRINPDTGAPMPDNPLALANHPDPNARRVVAYGLRNPFRIAMRPGTSELWIGDVGWRIWDEIDRLPDPAAATVKNFGWPCYEGNGKNSVWDSMNLNICENLYLEAGAVSAPFFQYRQGSAVVAGEACGTIDSALSGLAFYQGGSYPAAYHGALFFADYARTCIWVMPKGANGDPDPARVATFVAGAAYPVHLEIGPAGDLFYVDIVGGGIHRISYVGVGGGAPIPILDASPTSGAAPLTVNFDGRRSSDPEGGPLTFSWDVNGDGTFGDSTLPNFSHTYTTNGSYTVQLRATDQSGLSAIDSAVIVVGNRAPTATIDTPPPTLRWVVGQQIGFSGHATDPENGALPASALHWSLVIKHCSTPTSCHEHFVQNWVGVASGSFTAPAHEQPSYLELRLTATDSGGLTGNASVRLDPQQSSDDFVRYASHSTAKAGAWRVVPDSTAAGGERIELPDLGAAKLPGPLANPADYFDVTADVQAGRAYRLWVRGRAQGNSWANDSVFVQFSGSVDASGVPQDRIGTTGGLTVTIEDCSGCGLSGWGWQDNGYGVSVLGPPIYFAASGPQTIRVQRREDGVSLDQIVLSPSAYINVSPGSTKNDMTILPESGAPPAGGGEIVRWANHAIARQGTWQIVPDASAAGGQRMEHPDAGAPKVAAPLANPPDFFEVSVDVQAGTAYRLWVRGRAAGDFWGNDSVYVQFSGSVDASGAPVNRIGTMQGLTLVIEDCSGCGLAGWGWQDTGYGTNVLGPLVYFASAGPQTIRIQGREDGMSIDQVVLSAAAYLNRPPGPPKSDTTILLETGSTPPSAGEVVKYAGKAAVKQGTWQVVADGTAAGSVLLWQPDAGAPKLPAPQANPANYFELTFDAQAGLAYRLWLRGRAQQDAWANDSVFVQFSGSVSATGSAENRIGTTQALIVTVEDCTGCGLVGWGWQDNGYGTNVLGPPIYFATTGRQTIRVQGREDGISIDQIVLSPAAYLNAAPGVTKNDTTILPETP
jgi:glucose/arabinose dehydrogenase/PKD repeat protein